MEGFSIELNGVPVYGPSHEVTCSNLGAYAESSFDTGNPWAGFGTADPFNTGDYSGGTCYLVSFIDDAWQVMYEFPYTYHAELPDGWDDWPPGGGGDGGDPGTTVTCSVSPCVIAVSHTMTIARPTSTPQDYEDMAYLGLLFLVAGLGIMGIMRLGRLFRVTPNDN